MIDRFFYFFNPKSSRNSIHFFVTSNTRSSMLRKRLAHSALSASRCLHTSTIAEALPAVAVAPKKGLFANIFGGSSTRITTPLSDPLPGVALPEHIAPPAEAPKTQLTTLSNGLKVASENTPVSRCH